MRIDGNDLFLGWIENSLIEEKILGKSCDTYYDAAAGYSKVLGIPVVALQINWDGDVGDRLKFTFHSNEELLWFILRYL